MAETEGFKNIRSRFEAVTENQKLTKPLPGLKPAVPVKPNIQPSGDRYIKRPIPKALSSSNLPVLPYREHLKNAGSQRSISRTTSTIHNRAPGENRPENVVNKPSLPIKPLVKKPSTDVLKTNFQLPTQLPKNHNQPELDKCKIVPKLKHLPSKAVLGTRPEKPARPPYVDLEIFNDSSDSDTYVVMKSNPDLRLSASQPNLATGSPKRNIWTPTEENEEIYENIQQYHGSIKEKSVSLYNFVITETPGPEEIYDDIDSILEQRKLSLQSSSSIETNVLITNWRNDTNLKKMEKFEMEFRRKFKFAGPIKVITRMMVDPNAIIQKPGDKDLPYTRGEIIDVIQLTNAEKILCRNFEGRFGYLPRNAVLKIEKHLRESLSKSDDIYDDTELISSLFPAIPSKPRFQHSYVTRMFQRKPSQPRPQTAAEIQQKENLKRIKNEAKEMKELKKKFKIEGEIKVLTRMMVVPSAGNKRGGGKDLPISKGEILEVIQYTNQEKILCRNSKGKYGYVKRRYVLQAEKEIYDDVAVRM
ncbi:FYN-binding -like [Pelobates cultripes]|uniref:FYN-binding -like n=1 Tax=Pelobates cultripes TaxID=61616 RepID=A0AAD1S4T3_PELCU|nr:FYN-binding -like [Pelobates cultripes]